MSHTPMEVVPLTTNPVIQERAKWNFFLLEKLVLREMAVEIMCVGSGGHISRAQHHCHGTIH